MYVYVAGKTGIQSNSKSAFEFEESLFKEKLLSSSDVDSVRFHRKIIPVHTLFFDGF